MASRGISTSVLLCVFALSCRSHEPDVLPCEPDAVRASLRQAMREALETHPGNAGWLMSVRIPSAGLEFSEAVHSAKVDALDARTPFRIASVTKTYLAAALLRLVEDGKLSLDDTVDPVVPAPYPELLRAGGYRPEQMTVAQLLTHTSGLYDYAQSEDYLATVLAAPERVWTREAQVRFAMEHGRPEGTPGERYVYSDTGYLLLGALLEEKTGLGLGEAYRRLLGFERLGLRDTWLETRETPSRAPQSYDGFPLANIDATADLFGGGGLVSTTPDVSRFFQALFSGEVFTRASTLERMTRVPPTNTDDGGGMGIFRLERAGAQPCYLHEGFWGITALVCPELDVSVAIAGLETTQLGTGMRDLLRAAVKAGTECRPAP
ncbi:beta-lactamase family protein [Myxococcus stipitatus]|uniref:serine hydrolase domain-containing protein n=1 Tax=Myxococcus stipitatus TaxID=83455 RepID=UPI0031452219